MIQRRAKSAGIATHVGNHTFRAHWGVPQPKRSILPRTLSFLFILVFHPASGGYASRAVWKIGPSKGFSRPLRLGPASTAGACAPDAVVMADVRLLGNCR